MIWWKYLLIDAALGVCIALILRRFVCVLCYVKGRSMMDTLSGGEIVFARRRRKHAPLNRFDVVLCRYPGRKGLFIKRVIGLPGEKIAVTGDVLHINGEPVAEDFPRRSMLRDMEEREIPLGACFLMGDNRPASSDSRRIGPIDQGEIIAVAKCVVFPLRKMRKIG